MVDRILFEWAYEADNGDAHLKWSFSWSPLSSLRFLFFPSEASPSLCRRPVEMRPLLLTRQITRLEREREREDVLAHTCQGCTYPRKMPHFPLLGLSATWPMSIHPSPATVLRCDLTSFLPPLAYAEGSCSLYNSSSRRHPQTNPCSWWGISSPPHVRVELVYGQKQACTVCTSLCPPSPVNEGSPSPINWRLPSHVPCLHKGKGDTTRKNSPGHCMP